MKTSLLVVALFSISLSVLAQNDWVLKKEKDGIRIYSRHSDISKFNDLKILVDLPGTIAQLSAILLDVEKYPEWVYSTKSSVLIKRISREKLIYYSEIDAPWPVSNRDFYANFEVKIDTATRSMKVFSQGMKDYATQKKDLVRIPMSRGMWNISTLSDKIIHLEYILQVDPGGSVPAWILNMFSTKGPLETFLNLKHKMSLLNS